ncbi:ribonuclease H-like domain-containing protein [Tanacetum coccineum]
MVAKATKDEAVLWHRRLGHVNFKNINKFVKGNLVRGLPSKRFKLDHSCLACRKGKQHRASCKKIEERTVREPLELLHMDLFGHVSVESVNKKKYCLVVTDDCSRYSWVLLGNTSQKVKVLPRKSQNPPHSTSRVMLAPLLDVLWTLYLIPSDHMGKFDGKSEEGYLLGYSTSSKGFRVYNRVTRKVQDCLHVDFLEDQENQKGKGPDWMFDLELLTPSMNYIPVRKENYGDSGGKVSTYADVEDLDDQQFIVHGPSINAAQNKHLEERTADKEVPLSSEEQALHDELVSLMHQESIAKVHNDAQRNAFEEEKRRIALEKGKESANSTLTLSTANTPSQSTGNTPTGFFDSFSSFQ